MNAAGPAPSAELLSPDELAPIVRKSAGRIRRHCGDGSLHAHRDRDVRGARWSIPRVVGLAWKAGQDEDAQRRACPLCAVVPSPRRSLRAV